MPRVPLNALQAFEAVAVQQGFARAARALYVTPAAVSQQVRGLEATLGFALFHREGRSIRLTADGARLLPGVKRGFDQLRLALAQARAADDCGRRLHLSLLPSFLQRWLLPRLPDFQRACPELDLRLSASLDPVDFADGEFDAAIRIGGGRWPGLRTTRLLDEWLLPVCRPDLLRRHGPIARAADLQHYALLHSEDEPWSLWLAGAFGAGPPREEGQSFEDSATLVIAAERGQGLALARWSLAAGSLADGLLVCPARIAVRYPNSSYLVTPPERHDLRRMRLFREWLVAATADFAAPPLRLVEAPKTPRARRRGNST